MLKLESYGFHKAHCMEALNHCQGDVDQSLELLFSKYFPDRSAIEIKATAPLTDTEIIEMRQDEMLALQAIYDTAFEEQEPNKVWQLKFKVDHLLLHSPSEQKKKKLAELETENARRNGKKQEKCRNIVLKGHCKYGNRCKYSHKVEAEKADKPYDSNIDPNWFYLEVRFPKDSLYPYEAPMVFLKTTCPDIPHTLCLRLTRRIVEEAREIAKDDMPSIYTISELLQMDEELTKFLKSDRFQFISSKLSLFHVDPNADSNKDTAEEMPTHYTKGRPFSFTQYLSL